MPSRALTLLAGALSAAALSADAQAATQCFSAAGTYGNLVVTTSGSGCGNPPHLRRAERAVDGRHPHHRELRL